MNVLILAITVLPFRTAFAMSVDSSDDGPGQHCKGMAMDNMSQNGHIKSLESQSLAKQSPDVLLPDIDGKVVTKGNCCNTSDNDCAGCAHITAVYDYGFLQFSNPSGNEAFSEMPFSFITRVISPPSRPPLKLHV